MKMTLLLLALAIQYSWGADTDCLSGINADLEKFIFAGGKPEKSYENLCTSKLSVHSMWAAAMRYCKPQEIDAGAKQLGDECTKYGSVAPISYADVRPILTDEYMNELQVVEFTDINPIRIWNNSVLISPTFHDIGRRTVATFNKESALHAKYGWAIYGFWGGILLFGVVNRLLNKLSHDRRARARSDIEESGSTSYHKSTNLSFLSPLHRVHRWFRTNFVIPAAFGSHHQRLYWGCSIPTRMEAATVLLFWIFNIGLCCASYETFYPNVYYTRAIQTWRYIADRTGIVCYANLPWIWIFSGRNSIFLWATGWSYSTFNVFHRHIAAVTTIEAVVHSICRTAIEIHSKSLATSWKEKYWYMGAMADEFAKATIVMSFMLISSSTFVRMKCYEAFLILHVVFAVLTIVGLWYHTAIFDGKYNPYLWSLIAIWSFDRFARLVRLAYCNVHLGLSKTALMTYTTARYSKEADVIELNVVPGSSVLKPKPGQHYFLYQPLKWKGWENHPFTLACWKELALGTTDVGSSNSALQPMIADTKEVQVLSGSASPPESPIDESASRKSNSSTKTSVGQYKLTFYARPFGSWTRRLRNECLKSPTSTITAKILIEGPYGHPSPLYSYENVLFIVGGTGISGALSYLHDHVTRASQLPPATQTQHISIIWSTKQSAMIHALAAHELRPIIGRTDIDARYYATSHDESPSTPKAEKLESAGQPASAVDIAYSRPDIRTAIMSVVDHVGNAGSAGGRIVVLTCGPAGMADDARAAVHKALKEGKRGVEYFEETFGW